MHEKSETVQRPDGRWINVYGKDTPQAGRPLGPSNYATVDAAVAAARTRSLRPGEDRTQDTSVAPYLLDREPDPYYWAKMRHGMLPIDPMHAIVAPLEHREAAREMVGENPLMAAPLAAGIPLWSLVKLLGLAPKGPNSSPASLDEIFAGYEGLFSGLMDTAKKRKPKKD